MNKITQYIKDSFLLVYWLIFKPISFNRKYDALTEQKNTIGTRFKYTLQAIAQALPAMLIMVGIVGYLYPYFTAESFNWFSAAFGVAVGVALGVAVGVAVGVAFGVCVALGVAVGMALGVALGVAFGVCVALGVTGNLALDIAKKTGYIMEFMGYMMGYIAAMMGEIVSILSAAALVVALISYAIALVFALGVTASVASVASILRVYLWLPELFWVGLLDLRQVVQGTPPSLKLLPFYYDELIFLPLPFLERWLIENYDIFPNQTLETLDYLTNTTNQQKLAAKARISIVVESLSRVQNFSQLTAIYQQFTWLPNPLPAKFDQGITELLEISQDAYAAETATSVYRTVELLNRPIQRLADLQKALAFNKSRHRLSLGQTSQRWLSLLTTAQENYRQQVGRQAEIPQAYIAGNGLNPDDAKERFKGRLDIFQQIETISLSDSPPVLLLYGGRRTGKTSSLKYLPQKVDSSLVPLLVDLQGTALSEQMSSFAQSFAGQMIDFARANHRLNIPPPSPEALNHDPFPTLLKWFQTIENLKPHKRFLLCLDEFERLSEVINATNNKAPLNFFRSVMQNNQRWILLFSGSHTLDELEPYWNDALINAQSLRMTYLHRNEAIDLIRHPVQEFPDIYSDATVERILYWTNCQPYLIQLLGTVLVDELNKLPEPLSQRPTPDDIDQLIPKVRDRGINYFRELWKSTITEEQRQILSQFMSEGHLENVPKRQIKTLIEDKEILIKTNEHYAFQVPLAETYFRQQVE
jgi:AAA+ ATPase superfamily predicted ATPase